MENWYRQLRFWGKSGLDMTLNCGPSQSISDFSKEKNITQIYVDVFVVIAFGSWSTSKLRWDQTLLIHYWDKTVWIHPGDKHTIDPLLGFYSFESFHKKRESNSYGSKQIYTESSVVYSNVLFSQTLLLLCTSA